MVLNLFFNLLQGIMGGILNLFMSLEIKFLISWFERLFSIFYKDKLKVKIEPLSNYDSKNIFPSNFSAIIFDIVRPNPIPLAFKVPCFDNLPKNLKSLF